jgi:flagellar hook-associated protein 1 FlgK
VPNDLYDQRDQMVRELNKFVRVTTVTQSDGAFNVFIGKGQPLVIGSQAYSLAAVADPADPEKFIIAMNGVGGNLLTLPESQITGGTLGGLLAFRRDSLDGAQNALGRIAITLAQNFNDQHNLGMDLTGQLGGDVFVQSTPVVRASSANNGGSGGNGQPDVVLDTTRLSELSNSDYRLSVSSSGTGFQLTRISDGAVVIPMTAFGSWPPAPPADTVDGIKITFPGSYTAAANDSFLIQPTRAGAKNIALAITDPRSIAAAAPIRTSATLSNTGTASIDAGVVLDTTNPAFNPAVPPNFNTTGELSPPILIKFDTATTYSIWDNSNPLSPILLPVGPFTYTAGANLLFPGADPNTPDPALPDYGYEIKITGKPAANDTFTVGGNKNGVSDNRNAQLLGALQTTSTMLEAGGRATASYQSAYSQIVSEVGSKTREVKTIGAAQQGLAEHAITSMQQISGVNLDEEAANLLRYQQAYQASAKILEIATRVFDEVLALGR